MKRRMSVIDEVQLKDEFRRLYKEIGDTEILTVLYELCLSVQLLLEVIKENSIERS